jgi:AsmA protein
VRKTLWIIGVVIVVIILVVVCLPLFIDANQFRPTIESALGSNLNRKVQLGNISLAIFSGGASVDNLSISDDPAFNNGPFLTAKSLKVGVELMPLIFSRQLHVTSFTIEQPEVTLLRSPSGKWNYSTLGTSQPTGTPAAQKPQTSNSTSAADISVQKLAIENGTLYVGDIGKNRKRQQYSNVSLEASDLSFTSPFPFKFSAQTPGNGSIQLDGNMGPLNRTDMEQTPMSANLQVKGFNLGATGFVDPASGLAGILDFTGTLSSDGTRMVSKGKITANKLQAVEGGAPAGVPINVDYDATYELKPQTGTLTQGDVHIGGALAHLTGNFNASGEVASVQMKLNGQNMPAKDLESVLPAVVVILPPNASLQSGTMNVDLAINGPVNRLVTTGPVSLSNAKLANFNLGSKMGAIASLAGLPKPNDTEIQTFSTEARVAPEGTQLNKLNLVVAGLGALTGDGTISANRALDFKMQANLSGPGSTPVGQLANIAGSFLGGGKQGKGGGIPFLIQGTTSDPKFVPDLKGFSHGLPGNSNQGQQQGASGLLQGLLKKKP